MSIVPNQKEQGLLKLLLEIPPNMEAAEKYLQNETLTADEVTRASIAYANECFCDAGDFAHEQEIPHPTELVFGLHSTYIYDVIALLLRYGLEPNRIHDNWNIMEILKYVDNEFVAADALALLLEHGGKTDTTVPDNAHPIHGFALTNPHKKG